MKKDIVWLDYARTFGIFLVIFGHCLQTFPAWKSNECLRGIWDYVYLFHMPLFFIISGFLFKAPNVNKANIRYGGGKIDKVDYITLFDLPTCFFVNINSAKT